MITLYTAEYESEFEAGTIEVYAENIDQARLAAILELQDDSYEIGEIYES